MTRTDGLAYAIAAIGLGAVGLVFGDFARQWQPVPADIPSRTALAYASGALLVAGGLMILPGRLRPLGAGLLALFYALWVIALHGPRVAAAPANVSVWLGFAEIASLAAAGLLLAIGAGAPRLRSAALVVYGLCPLVFGLSHFVYADFTADMVPEWIPARLFWAYATGAAHAAAGLAILVGFLARPAAMLLALMMGLFVLLVHVPRVVASPASHHEWTMIFIALSLTGAAWIVAASLRRG